MGAQRKVEKGRIMRFMPSAREMASTQEFSILVWISCDLLCRYHKQYYHGVSSVTGLTFCTPTEFRLTWHCYPSVIADGDRNACHVHLIPEGKCHVCEEFIPLVTPRKRTQSNSLSTFSAARVLMADAGAEFLNVEESDGTVKLLAYADVNGEIVVPLLFRTVQSTVAEAKETILSQGKTNSWFRHAHKCHHSEKPAAKRGRTRANSMPSVLHPFQQPFLKQEPILSTITELPPLLIPSNQFPRMDDMPSMSPMDMLVESPTINMATSPLSNSSPLSSQFMPPKSFDRGRAVSLGIPVNTLNPNASLGHPFRSNMAFDAMNRPLTWDNLSSLPFDGMQDKSNSMDMTMDPMLRLPLPQSQQPPFTNLPFSNNLAGFLDPSWTMTGNPLKKL